MKLIYGFSFFPLIVIEIYLIQNLALCFIDNSHIFILYGVATFAILNKILKFEKYKFIDTFFHEVSHMVFAFLTLSKPSKLVVSPNDKETNSHGFIEYQFNDGRLNSFKKYLISLAPYFFLPLTFTMFMILWVALPSNDMVLIDGVTFSKNSLNILLFLIGFFYAYDLRRVYLQARPYQSDFDFMGYKKGIIFVIFIQLLFLLFYLLILFSPNSSFGYLKDLIVEISNINFDELYFKIRFFLYDCFDIWI